MAFYPYNERGQLPFFVPSDRREDYMNASHHLAQSNNDVVIDYTNHKGRRSMRRIFPYKIKFSTGTPDHPEPGWFLDAYCHEKRALRTFALKDVHSWKMAESTPVMKVCARCYSAGIRPALYDASTMKVCPAYASVSQRGWNDDEPLCGSCQEYYARENS